MAKQLIKILFILLLSVPCAFAADGKITSVNIVGQTFGAIPSCLKYRILGVCFWMHCDGPFCWVSTTLKVSEYLPDTIDSVFSNAKSDPWVLTNTVVDPVGLKVAKLQSKTLIHDPYGFGDSQTSPATHTEDDRLKEVDVLGNPVAQLFKPPAFIPSTSIPFLPYYISMVDAVIWRGGLTEMLYPQSYIPGDDDIGKFPYNVWGSLYPRTGFLMQSDDAKAAAVIAQRATNIITHGAQAHIDDPLPSGSCGPACTAYRSKVNDANTVEFQMVYPIPQKTCGIFGVDYLTHLLPWGSKAAAKGNGNYVWVMWRHYQGCINEGGKYLGST